jgi:hypothetical protein
MSDIPTPSRPDPPHLPLLRALAAEMCGRGDVSGEPLAGWAGDVVQALLEASFDQALDALEVLKAADCAFRKMLCSESWRALLDGALLRPGAFARSLLIMLHGSARRRPGAAKPPSDMH